MPQGEGTYGKTRGRPPKLRAKKLKDQKGRTGRLTPSYGDVSTTGRTGPKKARNLKVAEGASVRPIGRKTSAEKRAVLKKHPSTAIAMNSEGKYIHGDTYRPEMKKAGYNRI